jgi:hypothetical protein
MLIVIMASVICAQRRGASFQSSAVVWSIILKVKKKTFLFKVVRTFFCFESISKLFRLISVSSLDSMKFVIGQK